MKIAAVYARVQLVRKPDWLEAFREHYNNSFEYHVTLKQGVYIEESQLPDIQRRLTALLRANIVPEHTIRLTFDHLKTYREDSSILIMARPSDQIVNLQKSIVSALAQYKDYCEPELESYETNFEPHITIAFDLGNRFDAAIADVQEDVLCEGVISEIVLSCINDVSLQEINNPANRTIYRL